MKEKCRNAQNYIDSKKDAMIQMLEKIVNIESGPDNKVGIDKVCSEIISELKETNCEIETYEYEEAGNTHIIDLKFKNAKETLLFNGHADTVFKKGTLEGNPFRIENGLAYGPGVLDMKGGLTIATYVIKALNENNVDKYNIRFCLTGDEEIAHMKSDADIKMIEAMKGAKAAFTFETGFIDNGLVVGRKGGAIFKMKIKGIAAHTGNDPDKGRSAIWEAAEKICKIQKLTDVDNGLLFNVGKINGGMGANSFAEDCELTIGVRYRKNSQFEYIESELERISNESIMDGTSSELSFLGRMRPMERMAENDELFEIVKKSALELGIDEPHAKMVGGASDSSCSVSAGVPTVCAIGIKGQWNHSKDEYAVLDSLTERAKLVIQTIYNLD